VRKATPAFGGNQMTVINPGNDHVFAYVRTIHEQVSGHVSAQAGGQRVLVAANFTEHAQPVAANELRLYGLDYRFRDLISGKDIVLGEEPLVLEPYQVIWLANLN